MRRKIVVPWETSQSRVQKQQTPTTYSVKPTIEPKVYWVEGSFSHLSAGYVDFLFYFLFFARKMVLHIWNAKFVSPRLSFFSINSVLRMQCIFVVGTLRCFRHRVYTLYLWSFVDKSLEFSDCDYISAMPLPVWVTQCSCFFEGDNVEPRSQEMPWNWRSSLSNIRWKVRKIAFCPGDRYFSAKPSIKCLN